jgi:hypothetical protein
MMANKCIMVGILLAEKRSQNPHMQSVIAIKEFW